MEKRYTNRYQSFVKSLLALEEARSRDLSDDLTHDYDGTLAEDAVYRIVDDYLPVFEKFRVTAGKYIGKMEEEGD